MPSNNNTHHAYKFASPCDQAEEFSKFFSNVGESTFIRSQEELKIEGDFVVDCPRPEVDVNIMFRPQSVDTNTVILAVKNLNITASFGSGSTGLRFLKDAL